MCNPITHNFVLPISKNSFRSEGWRTEGKKSHFLYRTILVDRPFTINS